MEFGMSNYDHLPEMNQQSSEDLVQVWILFVDGVRCVQTWEPTPEERAGATVLTEMMSRKSLEEMPDFEGF
jgi:hypothetical protein